MQRLSGERTIDALITTVGRFWPDAQVELHRSRILGTGHRSGAKAEFLVVPDLDSPRLLAPVPARAAAASMRRYSIALSQRERNRRAAVALALRGGGARVILRDRVAVRGGSGDSLVQHLEDLLGEPVDVTIGIGNVRANRKPVLGIWTRSGHALGFAKVGDSPVARAHVLGEADHLEQLATRDWTTFDHPQLLHRGSWNGLALVVMTALPADTRQPENLIAATPWAAMEEIGRSAGGQTGTLASCDWWHRRRDDVASLESDELATRAVRLLDEVEQRLGSRAVVLGAWHGDMTPWNMALRGGRLQLWDWERFATGVPRGMDELHYVVSAHKLRVGFSLDATLEALRRTAPGCSDPDSEDAIATVAYLVEIATRYLSASVLDGGEIIRPRAEVMLDALDAVLNGSSRFPTSGSTSPPPDPTGRHR